MVAGGQFIQVQPSICVCCVPHVRLNAFSNHSTFPLHHHTTIAFLPVYLRTR